VELTEEWVYTHMGFEEDHKIAFPGAKVFAYRANVDELAQYLLKLLADKELREKMGVRARAHAVENFEYRKAAKKITDLARERLRLS